MPKPLDPPRFAVIFPTMLAGTWCWENQWPVLEKHGFIVKQLDEAFVMVDCEPSMQGLEDRCAELIDDCDGACVLMGNSMGGLMALRLAQRFPGKVVGVVVSGSPGLGPTPNLGIGTKAMLSPAYADMIRSRIFVDPTCVSDEVVAFALAAIAKPRAARAGVRLLRSLRRVDVAPDIEGLTTPTVMIWGSEDSISPPDLWREAADRNRHVDFHEIEQSGHSPMYESPAAFNVLMDRFLTDLSPTAPVA